MNQIIAISVASARDMNSVINTISGLVSFIALSHFLNVIQLG
jgi:hypothetical protein